MRRIVFVLGLLLAPALPAFADVGIGFSIPGVRVGINLPVYPRLVAVPGYPVYYAPGLRYNYFFYDGLYWVFEGDNWYASSWYNGPWDLVAPDAVPLYLLRVPVRYYRHPPTYFRGWRLDLAPRWGEHWGREWESHHNGWDRWNHREAPRRAPLPTYQRQYSGAHYPRAEEQRAMRSREYHYQPHEAISREHYDRNDQRGGDRGRERGRERGGGR